jgi:starch phosphorylase
MPGDKPDSEEMSAAQSTAASSGALLYSAQVSSARPASEYTVRIVPHHPSAFVPLEMNRILWQR